METPYNSDTIKNYTAKSYEQGHALLMDSGHVSGLFQATTIMDRLAKFCWETYDIHECYFEGDEHPIIDLVKGLTEMSSKNFNWFYNEVFAKGADRDVFKRAETLDSYFDEVVG